MESATAPPTLPPAAEDATPATNKREAEAPPAEAPASKSAKAAPEDAAAAAPAADVARDVRRKRLETRYPYYLNGASDMDGMIEAYRATRRSAPAAPPATRRAPRRRAWIEVLWEVTDNETEEARDVWWRARVEGRTPGGHVIAGDDEVPSATVDAFRVLYVARPELSEPEPTAATVAFLSRRALLDVDGDCVLQWRPEGSDDAPRDLGAEIAAEEAALSPEEDAALAGGPAVVPVADLGAAVDAALRGALGNVADRMNALPRDAQCAVADKIAQAKAHMTAGLRAHLDARADPAAPITPADIQTVLRSLQGGAFGTA
ncbi:hypothetical protein SO694_00058284 [Aureococcus anophagefferens]|uniref:Uncharacterized protein n=1 Tax=Aureococcus anophagefferens TaxID=44056 RepID=A0ABR1FZ51_AURAN